MALRFTLFVFRYTLFLYYILNTYLLTRYELGFTGKENFYTIKLKGDLR